MNELNLNAPPPVAHTVLARSAIPFSFESSTKALIWLVGNLEGDEWKIAIIPAH
jgi:hypothetical protein